jgi:hypothetical protein
MKKIANIYERLSCWFLHPESRTVTGLWIATPPFVCLAMQSGLHERGQAILDVLGASRDGQPIPGDDDNLVSPLLQMTNAESWAAFMAKARCVSICSDNDRLTVTPFKKLRRPKGAIEEIPAQAAVLRSDAAPEEIAEAIVCAFTRCE